MPTTLTLEQLRQIHRSVPANPLLAEPLYLTKYIERMGTGTSDIIRLCRVAGLPEPGFSITDGFVATLYRPACSNPPSDLNPRNQVGTKSGPSRDQVDILHKCQIESSLLELMELSGKTNRTKFRDQVLKPLLVDELIEPTIPDKPTSSNQRYRLTAKGRQLLATLGNTEERP